MVWFSQLAVATTGSGLDTPRTETFASLDSGTLTSASFHSELLLSRNQDGCLLWLSATPATLHLGGESLALAARGAHLAYPAATTAARLCAQDGQVIYLTHPTEWRVTPLLRPIVGTMMMFNDRDLWWLHLLAGQVSYNSGTMTGVLDAGATVLLDFAAPDAPRRVKLEGSGELALFHCVSGAVTPATVHRAT
jgi:hypothetical protein